MLNNADLNKEHRFEIIDFLRGIAILLVVIRHVQLRIPFEKAELIANIPEQIYNILFVSGNEGVRMFFVISGFLITMNTLNRYSDLDAINIKEFYKFRFARIAPCLIGLIAVLSVLHFLGVKAYVINSKFSYFEVLFSAVTFHLNWLEGMKGYLPPSWDVLWSLSVEEVFYLVFPIICIVSKKKEIFYLALVLIILIGPFNRLFLEDNRIWQSKAYLSCMDSIAIGCLFALVSHKKIISSAAIHSLTISGAAFVVFVLVVKRDSSFEFLTQMYLFKTILSIGVGLLLISSVRQHLQPLISKVLKPVILYGQLSYEIYLTHVFIVISGVSLYKHYDVSLNYALVWLVGIILISGILGYGVERYFSRPLNLWIRNKRFCVT